MSGLQQLSRAVKPGQDWSTAITASKNLSKVEIRQRQTAAVKHGVDGANRAALAGRPFVGLAADTYQQTLARWGHTDQELNAAGMTGDWVRETVRHQTVSDMCYMLVLAAAGDGDLEQWERWVKLWRSISGRSLKFMQQLKEMLDNDQTLDYEHLLELEQQQTEQVQAARQTQQNGL